MGNINDNDTAMHDGRIKWAGWIDATNAYVKSTYQWLPSKRIISHTILLKIGKRILAQAKLLENSVKIALRIITKSVTIVCEVLTRKSSEFAMIVARSDAWNECMHVWLSLYQQDYQCWLWSHQRWLSLRLATWKHPMEILHIDNSTVELVDTPIRLEYISIIKQLIQSNIDYFEMDCCSVGSMVIFQWKVQLYHRSHI
jgi:hypothetical protein